MTVRAALAALLVALTLGAAEAAEKFDGGAALKHVERLVAIGPRVAGSPGGARARDYIVGELKKLPGA